MKWPQNAERNSSRSPNDKKVKPTGKKREHDQERRERAYARGAERPKVRKVAA